MEINNKLTSAVHGLLKKYGRPAVTQGSAALPSAWEVAHVAPRGPRNGTLTFLPGWLLLANEPVSNVLPLLPWRCERRFVELKRLVDDRTINPVLMCRFSCIAAGQPMDLPAVLYREFDLAEWLTGSPITAVTATIEANRSANVILRLANETLCGLEVGVTLPPGTDTIDRHELIARRGVGCDRLVDSQMPQHSVYTFTAEGSRQYTDVDAELFGMSTDEVCLVRSAHDMLVHFEQADGLRRQHQRLTGLVRLAFESDRRCERLAAEGVC